MAKRICSRPDCDRVSNCKGLCRKHYKAMRRAQGYKDPQRDKQCKECNTKFKGRHDQNYCSPRCRAFDSNRARIPKKKATPAPKQPREKSCTWCKVKFEAIPHQVKIYCSPRCSELTGAYLASEREKRENREPRPTGCQNCGGVRRSTATYCDGCARIFKRQARARARKVARERGKEWASLTSHRSRARNYGVKYQSITPRDIYERDGWICGICSLPVDPQLKFPNLMSASLDHIIPMVKGGGHEPGNVQCAHFMCNSLKGDR